MAVFTTVSDDDARAFLTRYTLGDLVALVPIAEGVENTNYRLETGAGRKVLTLFERRTDAASLPFCLGLTDHLAARKYPAARPVRDRHGDWIGILNGRPAAIVDWVAGAWLRAPSTTDQNTAGQALAKLHLAAADFKGPRQNPMGPTIWATLLARCETAVSVHPDHDPMRRMTQALRPLLTSVADIADPALPYGPIHADYFPDNVLFENGHITGVIDFYFACIGPFAYDLAIALNAWAFDAEGMRDAPAFDAFLNGYRSVRALTVTEKKALPGLGAAAALRFTLTRLHDHLHHDPSWLVTPKDPTPFFRRIDQWQAMGGSI